MSDGPETHSPFTGRWIARIGNKIICQGGSPDQVFQAARSIRGKEMIIISYVPLTHIMSFPPVFFQIQEILTHESDIYLVGGAVRNALLGQQMNDLDFALPMDVERIARLVSRELKTDFYPLDQARESYRLIQHLPDGKIQYLDFSRMRGINIDADLLARDFTINAMAVNINDPQKLIDPLGGAQDLREKKIKACSPKSIQDDPIRILRAFRFAAEGGFKIEDETRRQLKTGVDLLRSTSPERKRDELFKILDLEQLPLALRAIDWLRGYPVLFPDIFRIDDQIGKDNFSVQAKPDFSSTVEILHLIKMVTLRNSAGDAESLVGGLVVSILGKYRQELRTYLDYHYTLDRDTHQVLLLSNLILVLLGRDTAPDDLPELIAREMNLSREEIDSLSKLTSQLDLVDHTLSISPHFDRRDAYRFFKTTGSTGIALTILYLGRFIARQEQVFNPDQLQKLLERTEFLWEAWWNKHDDVVNPKPLVNGDEIIHRFQLSPGPLIGKYLDLLKEEQAAGEITNRDEACGLLIKFVGDTL